MNEQQFEELKIDFITICEAVRNMAVKWGPDVDDLLTEDQRAQMQIIADEYDKKMVEFLESTEK